MIRINLLPVKEAQRALGRRQQFSVALLSITVALLVMVVPYLLQGRKLQRLDREIDQLQADITKLNKQTAEVRDLDKKKTDLEAKLKVIDDLEQRRVGPVHVLESLSDATPEKLWLVEFNEVNGAATLTGLALDNQTVAEFMRKLTDSKYFYDVDLETAQTETARTGAAVGAPTMFQKFIIKAHLDYLGGGGKPQPAASGATTTAPGKTGA